MTTTYAVIKKVESPIPDLRPPKGKIAVDLPENTVFVGAVVFAFAVLILGRIFRRHQPAPVMTVKPAIDIARSEFAAITDPQAHAECVRILRGYLRQAWKIGETGSTSTELVAAVATHPLGTAQLATGLAAFFAEEEARRFAPVPLAAGEASVVSQATQLAESLEAHRQGLAPAPATESAPPPPLPVTPPPIPPAAPEAPPPLPPSLPPTGENPAP